MNMNFNERIVLNTNKESWLQSPCNGIWRQPLAREHTESGHATSIVQYEPGSRFSHHNHPNGEEIFVISGTFSDETGDYPAGSYLRNPPGTSHAPYSENGCTLFVKLGQFQPGDHQRSIINTNTTTWLPGIGNLQVMPLHHFGTESTALVKWPAKARFQSHRHYGGEEILVLSGEFIDEHGIYPKGTWIRSPHLSEHLPWVEQETIIWVKTGHLLG